MNKFGVVLGVAAVAVIAGCKDPDYRRPGASAVQNDVRHAEAVPAPAPAPIVVEPAPAPAPIAVEPAPAPAPVYQAEPATTTYVVQNGDYLAKISKKYNVTIASIRKLNHLKSDNVRVGQKLLIPGKHDITESAVASAAAAPARKNASKKYVAYTGATKEYVVKGGDTLGAIAYRNGVTIRQLKELNGLSKDTLRVGQKLKIPAAGKAAVATSDKTVAVKKGEPKAAPTASVPASTEVKKPEATKPADASGTAVAPAEGADAAVKPEAAPAAEKSEPATITYVVKEGDDITGVSIQFGVSSSQIRELNNLAEGEQLVPGKAIKLPADAQQ